MGIKRGKSERREKKHETAKDGRERKRNKEQKRRGSKNKKTAKKEDASRWTSSFSIRFTIAKRPHGNPTPWTVYRRCLEKV
jgi:hypothetical protein